MAEPLRIEVLDKAVDVPVMVKERESTAFRPVPVEFQRVPEYKKDAEGFPIAPRQIQQVPDEPIIIERPSPDLRKAAASVIEDVGYAVKQTTDDFSTWNQEVHERASKRAAMRDAGLSRDQIGELERDGSKINEYDSRRGVGLAFDVYSRTSNPVNYLVPGFFSGITGLEERQTLLKNGVPSKDAEETFRGAYIIGRGLKDNFYYFVEGSKQDVFDFFEGDKPDPQTEPETPKPRPKLPTQGDYEVPIGCYANVIFMRSRKLEFDESGNPTFIGGWQPGLDKKYIPQFNTDAFGNKYPAGFLLENRGDNFRERFNFAGGGITVDTYPRNESGIVITKEALEIEAIGIGLFPNQKLSTRIQTLKAIYPDSGIDTYRVVGVSIQCDIGVEPAPFPDTYYYPPEPPPLPKDKKKKKKKDKEEDMGCCSCADIYRITKFCLDDLRYQVNVPVVSCEQDDGLWTPKIEYKTITVFANSQEAALAQAEIYRELAEIQKEQCECKNNQQEAIAAIPLSWQIRPEGNRPQMIILCGVKDGDKVGSAKYPITVPHWKGTANDKPVLPVYTKGNYEGIYTLSDNSKVTINGSNEAECLRILNALKPWIDKDYQVGALWKCGKINSNIKEQQVKPVYGKFFADGQKKNAPTWVCRF